MIYLLSTNRPEWAEFAYKQYKKCTGCKLIVLDNSKEPIEFWKVRGATGELEYEWLPDCKNVSQMFNHFADTYKGDDDLFYMDDDIEISEDTLPELQNSFNHGYDCAKLCKVYVTKGDKTGIWRRRSKIVGACWVATYDLWINARFKENTVEGVCFYFMDLMDYNCRFIWKPLANYMIHDKNVILREHMFEFNLRKVEL